MNKNKIVSIRAVMIFVIMFSFGTVLGLTAYMLTVKKSPDIPVQPTPNTSVISTSENILKIGTKPIIYNDNGEMFSVSEKEFIVLDEFSVAGLKNMSEECGTNKSERYFEELLSNYSKDDMGIEYDFKYNKQTQDEGIWTIMVISNKIGYTNIDDFRKDFDICEAGAVKYPFLISEKYLLFKSSCGTGYDDGSGLPHGCNEVQAVVEPSIKIQ